MNLVHVSVGSSTVTNVPLGWRIMWKPCVCKDREYVKTSVLSTQFCYKPKTAFISVQSLSRVQLFATPWTAARQASLSITNSWSSRKLTSIESVMPSSHLILCCPLQSGVSSHLSLSQHQGLFKWVSSSHQVVKVLELQLHHQSFQWIFRTDLL